MWHWARSRLVGCLAAGASLACLPSLAAEPAVSETRLLEFSVAERAAIAQHGPWPPPITRDASNRLSGRPAAVAFGERLFADPRLSAGGVVACSSCHVPAQGFVDGRALAAGQQSTHRHTPSVVNARYARWHGWGGESDSLWAASVRPLLDAAEMGPAERVVAERVRRHADLRCGYRSATGRAPGPDDDSVVADLGKSLAAFLETLVSAPTPFDRFRDALQRGDPHSAARYPVAAQRGLKLFLGEAGCALCHRGALFTHGEFDKAGIPVRGADGHHDWGRFSGVKALLASRYNLLSRHNDDATRATALGTRHVVPDLESYGAFRVPGLRNVGKTPPYMHDGSLPTLDAVLRHYSTIDAVKLHIAAVHPHAEPGAPMPPRPTASALRTLNLGESQIADLLAFLHTLSAPLQPVKRPIVPCR